MFRFLSLFFIATLLISPLFARTFRVSYDPDYAPFSFEEADKPYGLFVDIWRLWAKSNHYEIQFIKAKDWDDALEMAKSSRVDFFLGTNPYEDWMLPSLTYYKTKTALFTKKLLAKNEIHKVGIVGEDYKEEVQTHFQDVKILSYDDYPTLFKALIDAKVDAIYDDSLALSYYAIQHKYAHLVKKTALLSTTSNINAISSKKENIIFFNNGFKKLSTKDLIAIEKNWIFSKEERYFEMKKQYQNIGIKYVYDPDWKPFEFQDKMSKVHAGIIADILSLISSKTGVKFIPVASKSWAESVELVKEHKAQMFSAVPKTKKREKYLNFTKNNIYSYPAVLMAKDDSFFFEEKRLGGKSIGIIKENSLGKWVQEHNPLVLFKEFDSVESALDALDKGNIDYFAINGVTALYYINVLGYSQFKIHSIMDYMFHLKIAFLKDIPQDIVDKIDKGLSQVTQKELSDIYHKWTTQRVKKELNIELLLGIFLFIVLLIAIFIFINKKLKKIVAEKTNELRELNVHLEEKVTERTKALDVINKNIKANIEYASLIQNAILPLQKEINNYFSDAFVIWSPKDIVGGDIYFFEPLNEYESFLFVIDCTGHGVSGAFVTMLTKAIEEQFLLELRGRTYTPSEVLHYFNKTFKNLLHEGSSSSVGFDAGVIYINKRTKILKYSGAKIPLFYILNEKVKLLNADKNSVGYDHCSVSHSYLEHSIKLEDEMKFYITSDGFIDQNGGVKGFPLGKSKFQKYIEHNQNYEFAKQKTLFLEQLHEYQGNEERNDDIVFIGFEV